MHIEFIEDTHLHGGTQIWVAEAVRVFIKSNQEVSLLAPEGSWIVEQCRNTRASITTYDWDEVVQEDAHNQKIWTSALSKCDVAICTVHPPREGFHCSVFAARCIRECGLETHLIPKTGTIVPEYLREFYLPDETIHSSVIAIADFTRRYLVETYNIPADKVALVYQGTETDRFRHSESAWKEARKRYPLPKDASPILGSIGSFEHRKGHPVLFEALKELVNGSLPNVHLMLVGDGPDEAMLKEKVKALGLERSVSFFPFTDEPNYVFERLDMTVLPSLYKEGLPNVLLESMSMGAPVVSSNIGGVSEIVIDGETGCMVEPGDKSALSDAIHKVWANQNNYREMKIKARKLIEDQFDKATQFERFISHFHELKISD
ncbi:MAG: glycosyltransferase family 4 protein [Anaerolineae bacterium]|nr:glycosyltransferase family 4 protein [Anaerolineae bacterium]